MSSMERLIHWRWLGLKCNLSQKKVLAMEWMVGECPIDFLFVSTGTSVGKVSECSERLKVDAKRRLLHLTAGNTRMDAALDAMRQYGFEEKLVRETVEELLDVYEGTQGWPFIEDVSYKLLIETLLAKPQSPEEEKKKEDNLQDNARRDEVAETSSAATFTTGITEVGSSSLANQDPLLHASGGLDSASQTSDRDSPSPCNQVTDVKDSTVPAVGGGHGQGMREEPQNEQKPANNVTGSNYTLTYLSNVENTTIVKTTMIESSEGIEKLPHQRRKPYYGWIDDDENDKVELMCFPLPPLPEHIEKLIGQTVASQSGRRRQRRKSRWDEKPDDM